MTQLLRFVFCYELMTKIIVHCRRIPDEYCQGLLPDCVGSPVCEETEVGNMMVREWTCKLTQVEFIPSENDTEEMNSKPGKFEIDVRLALARKNPPVLLIMNGRGGWQLAEPTRRTKHKVYMNLEDKKILLACPGKGNFIQVPGLDRVETIEASCTSINGETNFVIANELHQPDSISCLRRVTSYEFMTGTACNDDGVLLQLGFFINNKMMELMSTCHRLVDGLTYYSRHVLDGSHFPVRGRGGKMKRKDGPGRPQFSYFNRALFRNFPPNKYYKQKSQNLSIPHVIDSGIGKREQFFARGHLTPRGDFIMATWQDATFLFVNVQPQWQEINGGNWEKIETEIRYNAAETAMKYEVITGVADQLRLNNTEVYLDISCRRLPVPKRFTKLVREIETNKCIAFLVNNFPQGSNLEPECRDICSLHNWPVLQDPAHGGYVYCCTYKDFIEVFPKASPNADCSGGELTNENRKEWQRER